MPKKATGTLVSHKTGWHARYWATVDGERTRLFRDLETKNKLTAQSRLAELVRDAGLDVQAGTAETFEAAADRVIEERMRTLRSARGELSYMRKHVWPVMGHIPVDEIVPGDIVSVLEHARDAGLSTQTLLHIRNAISSVFKHLRREGKVQVSPVPAVDELPECLPEVVDDRPKAILSDAELLIYLRYTDPRPGERFRGALRERQMMALFSRCVGGMRTSELHGLTWARARSEHEAFDALEVIRYKTRRKATRRGSKTPVRQLSPLGDTVLPMFLRFWWRRVCLTRTRSEPPMEAPRHDELLFPVRRAQRADDNARGARSDRVGQRRENMSWARALRRDVQRSFEASLDQACGAPLQGSRRWAELFEGTDDRRPLWFHNSRNAAAVVAERVERLNSAARFTGHASGQMLQHYREMAGEVDVVPVFAGLLPDQEQLLRVLRAWAIADGIPWEHVAGSPSASTAGSTGLRVYTKHRSLESEAG